MNNVKVVARPAPLPAGVEPHVLALVGRLLEVARQTLLAQDADGLRPSHFRLLSHVPPSGITITELAEALSMTKQGTGQFVTHLQGTGHLEVSTDSADRRRRVVRRTARGDQLVTHANRTVAAVEQHWRQQVGRERYEVFRSVLREIAEGRGATGPHAAAP
jgi:DNA-binding MarR family transcriptional regulator